MLQGLGGVSTSPTQQNEDFKALQSILHQLAAALVPGALVAGALPRFAADLPKAPEVLQLVLGVWPQRDAEVARPRKDTQAAPGKEAWVGMKCRRGPRVPIGPRLKFGGQLSERHVAVILNMPESSDFQSPCHLNM